MNAPVSAPHPGSIAARLDRLPLAWPHWRLALISQLFWGVVIAADGIPAKLYPFTWGPAHAFGLGAFSLLLAIQFGVGIMAGEYLIGMVSDRFGRRRALLVSSLWVALLLWPTALTDSFGWLLLFFGLSSVGMGGVLSTNVVYMGEFIPPAARGRVMPAAQILATIVFGLLGNLPAIFLVPAHYDWYIYLFCLVSLVVLVPLALWGMPESPRWLEAHGRHAEAERVTAGLEAECRRRGRLRALPEPDFRAYSVPVNAHVPLAELVRGEYGRRTLVLLAAWILGYGGMIYGFAGYEPVVLTAYGLDPAQIFAVILASTMGGGALALALCAWLGERVERRTVILGAGLVNAAALLALFFVHGVAACFVLIFLSYGAATAWLFSMYNYTAASYPTRLRATGTGLTDGFGHLGAIAGPLIAGALVAATSTAGFYGWYAYIILPGAIIPATLIARLGINQRRAILEQISQ